MRKNPPLGGVHHRFPQTGFQLQYIITKKPTQQQTKTQQLCLLDSQTKLAARHQHPHNRRCDKVYAPPRETPPIPGIPQPPPPHLADNIQSTT
jgi:hypothetical protein